MKRWEVHGKIDNAGYSPVIGYVWAEDKASANDLARNKCGSQMTYIVEA